MVALTCVLFMSFVDILVAVETRNKNSETINLALETVFEFGNRDSTDIKLLDNVENFVKRVKSVLKDKNTRRELKTDNIKTLTDFLMESLKILITYDDYVLEEFFEVLIEEINNTNYINSKFQELTENINFQTFIDTNLEKVTQKDADVIRQRLKSFIKVLLHAEYNDQVKDLLDYVDSLYKTDKDDHFEYVITKIKEYQAKNIKDEVDLNRVVRYGIKSIIFDYYSHLDFDKRLTIKRKLQKCWKNNLKPKSNPLTSQDNKLNEIKSSNKNTYSPALNEESDISDVSEIEETTIITDETPQKENVTLSIIKPGWTDEPNSEISSEITTQTTTQEREAEESKENESHSEAKHNLVTILQATMAKEVKQDIFIREKNEDNISKETSSRQPKVEMKSTVTTKTTTRSKMTTPNKAKKIINQAKRFNIISNKNKTRREFDYSYSSETEEILYKRITTKKFQKATYKHRPDYWTSFRKRAIQTTTNNIKYNLKPKITYQRNTKNINRDIAKKLKRLRNIRRRIYTTRPTTRVNIWKLPRRLNIPRRTPIGHKERVKVIKHIDNIQKELNNVKSIISFGQTDIKNDHNIDNSNKFNNHYKLIRKDNVEKTTVAIVKHNEYETIDNDEKQNPFSDHPIYRKLSTKSTSKMNTQKTRSTIDGAFKQNKYYLRHEKEKESNETQESKDETNESNYVLLNITDNIRKYNNLSNDTNHDSVKDVKKQDIPTNITTKYLNTVTKATTSTTLNTTPSIADETETEPDKSEAEFSNTVTDSTIHIAEKVNKTGLNSMNAVTNSENVNGVKNVKDKETDVLLAEKPINNDIFNDTIK